MFLLLGVGFVVLVPLARRHYISFDLLVGRYHCTLYVCVFFFKSAGGSWQVLLYEVSENLRLDWMIKIPIELVPNLLFHFVYFFRDR